MYSKSDRNRFSANQGIDWMADVNKNLPELQTESSVTLSCPIEPDSTIESSIRLSCPEPTSMNEPDPAGQFSEPDLPENLELIDRIGCGGIGVVWKVRDRNLQRILAIKTLRAEFADDPIIAKRFAQEAEMAMTLTHPNIAAVFGLGETKSGRSYLLMQHIDGESLADVIKRDGKLDEDRAINIFHQICDALAHSHMNGIVHRDLKPSNILLTKTDSGADLVHVVDFGIAKAIYANVRSILPLTNQADLLGTPAYMSPEQWLGLEITPASDIYSLGCILFEMLVGLSLFDEHNPARLIIKHLTAEPALGAIPSKLQGTLAHCLAKDSKDRPQSIDELLVQDHKKNNYRLARSVRELLPTLMGTIMVICFPYQAPETLLIYFVLWMTLFLLGDEVILLSSSYRNLQASVFFAFSTCLVFQIILLRAGLSAKTQFYTMVFSEGLYLLMLLFEQQFKVYAAVSLRTLRTGGRFPEKNMRRLFEIVLQTSIILLLLGASISLCTTHSYFDAVVLFLCAFMLQLLRSSLLHLWNWHKSFGFCGIVFIIFTIAIMIGRWSGF